MPGIPQLEPKLMYYLHSVFNFPGCGALQACSSGSGQAFALPGILGSLKELLVPLSCIEVGRK